MSFRARLVLGAAYLLLVVVVALAVPLALNVDRRARSEAEADVLASTAVLAARVSDLVGRANPAPGSATPVTRTLRSIARQASVGAGSRTLIVDAQGTVLADSTGSAALGEAYATPERPELAAALAAGRVDVRDRHSNTLGEDLLLVTVPVANNGAVVGALRVSAPLGEVESSVRSSWIGLVLIGLAVIGAGLVLAWILAGTVARPLERLGAAAEQLGEGDLDARVVPEQPREIETVGRTFNRMADALAASMASQRDFVANASHQLRTPLTGIKLRLEAIRAEGGAAAQEAAKADAELDRLSALVDDLLALAGASSLSPEAEPVDLGAAARAAVERWREPARSAEHELRLRDDAPERVRSAAVDVGQILDNLIENAIRYSPPGAEITVESTGRELVVVGHGPGDPRGRARARLRALLPRRRRPADRAGDRPGPRDRRRARRTLERRGRAARRPRDAHPRPLSRLLTRSQPFLKRAVATVEGMSRARTLFLVMAAVVLPVLLGVAVYATAGATSAGASALPTVITVPDQIARVPTTTVATTTAPPPATTTTTRDCEDDSLDPDCDPREDNSGKGSGSGGSGSSGSSGGSDDSSGSGSGSSGSSGGSDDSSGYGSSGSSGEQRRRLERPRLGRRRLTY